MIRSASDPRAPGSVVYIRGDEVVYIKGNGHASWAFKGCPHAISTLHPQPASAKIESVTECYGADQYVWRVVVSHPVYGELSMVYDTYNPGAGWVAYPRISELTAYEADISKRLADWLGF